MMARVRNRNSNWPSKLVKEFVLRQPSILSVCQEKSNQECEDIECWQSS
jgi:hypothetical protein